MPSSALERWSKTGAAAFSAELDRMLGEAGQGQSPRLVAAMRHGVLAGGKRLRPYLVLESARLCGHEGDAPLRIAAALEFIHCYSLVHDDLPAMDDDDMRRGQPTVHRAFDEATAILAGDALLTLAFGLIASPQTPLTAAARGRLVAALTMAAGIGGMVGGQMLDLEAEGRFAPAGGSNAGAPDAAHIERLQGLKTGALMAFGAEAGALMGARPRLGDAAALRRYGAALGLAFQIRDDLIDVEVDSATAGKATGKDTALGKATFVGLLGVAGARVRLDAVTAEGLAALGRFGGRAGPLAEVLDFNRTRRS